MDDIFVLESEALRVEIARRGAQIWRIQHHGRDRLWNGDATWWDYRAPILFPVVGKSPDGQVEIDGRRYPMQSHGFARERDFTVAPSGTGLRMEQRASRETHAQYPFDYRLTITFELAGSSLIQETWVDNDGAAAMPFCFGYHPAFLWPLDGAREDHLIKFEREEPDAIRRGDADTGLLRAAREASPVIDRTLRLADGLFTDGALQFDRIQSRELWYGAPGRPGLTVRFPDSPQLGIWTKPGAPYLCIEPWRGMAAEAGASSRLDRRPGAATLAPGGSARHRLELIFGAADPF